MRLAPPQCSHTSGAINIATVARTASFDMCGGGCCPATVWIEKNIQDAGFSGELQLACITLPYIEPGITELAL